MYYLGFLKHNTKDVVIFRSIKTPKKGDHQYFTGVMGPYLSEGEARKALSAMRGQGYRCANPAVSERQRRFMCAELGRLRSGKKVQTGMREGQLRDFCRKKNPAKYPQYKVGPYLVDNYKEAGELARVLSERTGKTIDIMQKLDSMTAWHVLRTVYLGHTGRSSNPAKISVSQIRRGTQHELEHTTDRRIARQIALDHLREDPKYYTHLTKMEKQYKKNPMSPEKALRLTRKVIAHAKDIYKDYQENPGKSYHDQKFMQYMKELAQYKIGSSPYIGTLAKAYEHLESAKESMR